MARYDHILFVCTNGREPGDPKRCCRDAGGDAILARLKALVAQHKLKGKVRVTRSGCLDFCAKGCAVVAFSANASATETWYTHVTPTDADALFSEHVLAGRRLERLVEQEKKP